MPDQVGMRFYSILGLSVLLGLPVPVRAQNPVADSLRAAAQRDGRAAAQHAPLGHAPTLSLVSGGLFGFFLPFVLGGEHSAVPLAGFGAGLVGMTASTRTDTTLFGLPAATREQIARADSGYRVEFTRAYRKRVSERLTTKVLGGAIIGTLAGLTALGFALAIALRGYD